MERAEFQAAQVTVLSLKFQPDLLLCPHGNDSCAPVQMDRSYGTCDISLFSHSWVQLQ